MTIHDALTAALGLYSEHTPAEINNGFCNAYAEEVQRLFPAAQIEWGCDFDQTLESLGCHMHVVYEGRYYDSETLEGVDHPALLPFYQRQATKEAA